MTARIAPERLGLVPWGWSAEREDELLALPDAQAMMPARVVCQEKTWLQVQTAQFRVHAKPGGRYRHRARGDDGLPVIGDWVDAEAFADIRALADTCQFRDCRHAGEPGCGVRRALDGGAVSRERVEGFLALERVRHGEAPARAPRWRRGVRARTT